MRLMLITDNYPPGGYGAANYLHALFTHVPDAEVIVQTRRVDRSREVDGRHPGTVERLPLVIDPKRGGVLNAIWNGFRWLPSALRLAKTWRPDVVHVGQVLPLGPVAWCLKRVMRIPYVVYTYSEELAAAFLRRRPVRAAVARYFLRHADHVVCISGWTRSLVVEHAGVAAARTVIIHPPYSPPRINRPLPHHLASRLAGKRVLLTTGRIWERKGHDAVVRALPDVLARFPDSIYLVVGDGYYAEPLRELVSRLDLDEHVVFAGALDDCYLTACYDRCEVFVSPFREERTHDVDGFGIVFLEAAARGKPVVAGNAGGAPEAIVEGKTGLLVDGFDPASVATAICELLDDPQRARQMGEAGRARVMAEFRPADQAQKVSELSARLVEEAGRT
jgi:phosphatidylinositol alpha-1,6-mannosyltransferase